MNRRNFIKNCIGCASVAALVYAGGNFYKNAPREGILFGNVKKDSSERLSKNTQEPILSRIEIHLTEHCNLNCKYCMHFSSIADEGFYNINKFETDLKRLSAVVGNSCQNIRLMGGEPLLHPQINDFFYITRKYFPDTLLDLITNGILLDLMPDSFWTALKNNEISVMPTVYNININWGNIIKKADKFGVKIIRENREEKFLLEKTEDYKVDSFYKLLIDLNGTQEYKNRNCACKGDCANFIDGKLYPCFVVSNIKHFNKKFGKNIPVTDKDYINIYKTNSVEEIAEFFAGDIPFCKYCAFFRHTNEPWMSLNEHDITEWT